MQSRNADNLIRRTASQCLITEGYCMTALLKYPANGIRNALIQKEMER